MDTTLVATSIIRSRIVVLYVVLNSQAIATACCLERGEPFFTGPTRQHVSLRGEVLSPFSQGSPDIPTDITACAFA